MISPSLQVNVDRALGVRMTGPWFGRMKVQDLFILERGEDNLDPEKGRAPIHHTPLVGIPHIRPWEMMYLHPSSSQISDILTCTNVHEIRVNNIMAKICTFYRTCNFTFLIV